MTKSYSLGRQIFAFASLPALSALSPLLVLPILSRIVDGDKWAQLLTAQAVGSICGILILSGWGIVGEADIAAKYHTQPERKGYYRQSLRSRSASFLIVIPISVAGYSGFVRQSPTFDVLLMLISAALAGLSLSWFAIGCGRPRWIAMYEVVPRAIATLASAPALLLTRSPVVYPALLILASIGGLIAFQLREFSSTPVLPAGHTIGRPSERWKALGLTVVGNVYGSAPLPLASYHGGPMTAGFASTDRIFRYSLFAITALANAIQPWVVGSPSVSKRSRQTVALKAHIILGLVGGAVLSILTVPVGTLLFGDHVAPLGISSVGYGLAFMFVSISTPLIRNVLVPSGNTGVVLLATICAAIAGLSFMFVMPSHIGVSSTSFGLALAELTNLVVMAPRAFSLLRTLHEEER